MGTIQKNKRRSKKKQRNNIAAFLKTVFVIVVVVLVLYGLYVGLVAAKDIGDNISNTFEKANIAGILGGFTEFFDGLLDNFEPQKIENWNILWEKLLKNQKLILGKQKMGLEYKAHISNLFAGTYLKYRWTASSDVGVSKGDLAFHFDDPTNCLHITVNTVRLFKISHGDTKLVEQKKMQRKLAKYNDARIEAESRLLTERDRIAKKKLREILKSNKGKFVNIAKEGIGEFFKPVCKKIDPGIKVQVKVVGDIVYNPGWK